MAHFEVLHLPKLAKHPLMLLLALILALGLGWSASVVNLAVSMGGPMALGGFFIDFLGVVGGLISLSGLYLILRNSSLLFGVYLLIAAYLALSLILWQIWEYPSVDGAFYMLRGKVEALDYMPPEPSAHVLAILLSSILFYLGIEYAILPTTSIFKSSWCGKLTICILIVLVLGLTLPSYSYFSPEPKLAYLSLPFLFGVLALTLQGFNSVAVLLGIFSINFTALFFLTYLANWLAID
ncbi:hypothetical protein [uncultured Thiothrix sp.]|uniref:hypothetical protein n=1 Tax=uncultured Thiothrix sp. TaxID=223185 RepID=UPI0026242C7C|nr:hypothetical protein [uncultured Thiothrix sp.]